MIIDPRPMTLTAWANALVLSLRDYGMIPQLTGLDWKTWVRDLSRVSGLSRFSIPHPEAYDNWREWAIHFNAVVGY